jgi:ATP/maltotriose-dependent transcriptional regulator MalT
VNAVPELPAHAVDRPDLRRRLDDGVERPVTLIVAPAGSGKSVLLAQWAAARPDLRIAWVDVDAADEEPVHLLAHLFDAFRIEQAEARRIAALMPMGGGSSLGAPVLDALVTALGARAPLVAVFDDVHRLTHPELLREMEWLVDHAPRGVRFVLASRTDLRRATTRRRLHDAIVELRAADLAFDATNAATLLEHVSGADVSSASVAAIVDRTEGWAAGLQLSAIAMRGRADPDAFATRFAGTDRLVADYLGEQVLNTLPDDRRRLLLALSALERMSADLIDAVTGGAEGHELLADLERQSMFLVPLDDRGEWFRFHHLFRQLLRYRLDAADPDAARRTALAAADWYVRNGDADMAVRSLLDAEAWDPAIDLILTRGREVYERGETATVAQWLSMLPDRVRRSRPDAKVLYGIVLGMSGRAAAGEDVLAAVATLPGATAAHRLIAQCYRASRVQFRSDVAVSLATAETALAMLREPPADVPDLLGMTRLPLLETQALGGLGRAQFLLGDLEAARSTFHRALHAAGGVYTPYRVHLLGSSALVEAWCGRIQAAEDLAREALALAEETALLLHPAAADAHLALALVRIERGEHDAARESIAAGMLRAAANQRAQLMWIAVLEHVLVRGSVDLSGAPDVAPPPIVADRLRAAADRLRRVEEASQVATPHASTGSRGWSRARAEQVARLLTARDARRSREALGAIPAPSAQFEPAARVEFLLLHAWLASLESRRSDTVGHAKAALALSERNGLVDIFVRVAPPISVILAATPDTPTPFVVDVLRAMQHTDARGAASGNGGSPLTEREAELLSFLPTRLVNAEIAQKLNLSVNTVKSHMTHIYRKLDVTTRDDAIARARELGLM